MPILVEREHLDRDMAGACILLEVIEHGPAEHIGQEDVERDRSRMVFLGQCREPRLRSSRSGP